MTTSTEYRNKAKRLQLIGSLIFVFLGGGLTVAITLLVGQPGGLASALQERLRDRVHPDLIGVVGILPLLPLLVAPLVIAVIIVALVDRRIGLKCPECGKSLTMRCKYHEVLKTKRCGLCGTVVLQE